jgi:outer membrane protein with beta-barrel domain
MSTTTKAILAAASLVLLTLAAAAQEFPRAEVGVDYSFARYAPSASFTKGHSLNGGGGSVIYNVNSYLGLKMDLQGYGSNHTNFTIPAGNPFFPGGASGKVQGNLFTYLFGPEIKVRAHNFHPFGHLLFGGAHSNVYGNAFKQICQPLAAGCTLSKAPSGDAFAMAFGGGVDIPINRTISIRPGEVDYLLTRFSNPFTNGNQNNFRYSAGIIFSFGGTK